MTTLVSFHIHTLFLSGTRLPPWWQFDVTFCFGRKCFLQFVTSWKFFFLNIKSCYILRSTLHMKHLLLSVSRHSNHFNVYAAIAAVHKVAVSGLGWVRFTSPECYPSLSLSLTLFGQFFPRRESTFGNYLNSRVRNCDNIFPPSHHPRHVILQDRAYSFW